MGKKSASGGGQRAKEPLRAVPAPPGGPEAVAPSPAPPPHGHNPRIEFKFFEELKHRNVVRVAMLYLVVCWLILDPVHVVFHMLEVPAWANRLVVILMAIGFPAVLLFAWVFEITPEGLKPTVQVDPRASIRPRTGRRLDRAIMVVMALAIAYFVADKFWLSKRLPAFASEQVPANGTTAPSAPAPPIPVATVDKSIAVLPFVDMSEKKDQEYFADGMAEELIDRLVHASDLRVISRTSSFYFKGKQATIADIAKTLGVSYVLEGSVRKSGKELRITTQLIRAGDGMHVWSQTYDRSLADIFKAQDGIAADVAQALQVALRSGTTGHTEANEEAYNLVLKGNYLLNSSSETDADKAPALYMEATRLDPNYAMAWAKFAWASWLSQDTTKALEAAQRALRIDPKLAYAHYVLGLVLEFQENDWGAAKAEMDRAIELDPDDLHARAELAWLTGAIFGQWDRKLHYLREVTANDPLDTFETWHLANSLYCAGRFNEAAESYRKLLQLNPGYWKAQVSYGIILLFLHQPPDARAVIEKATDEETRLWGLAILEWAVGHKIESDAAISRLEEKYGSTSSEEIAEAHAYRGEADAAFKWLDRTYELQRWHLAFVLVNPLLTNLHGNPRFTALLAKLKLDEWKRKVFASGA